ncbi:hypothetical protein PsorP6_003532 [Peronosclerospora sorghi]|uniref:Uncharacterized protein n=1 Tax=Peronosclerospora sorghi TaxID=230839 RepID=A0ACC0VP12_9STRA|nr:hypothetical protein PsorP6_003532 [Peronosclerospora sorghi]
MEFRKCLSLLAKRPEHTHDCEEEQHAKGLDLIVNPTATEKNLEETNNLTQLSSQELVQTFYHFQEKRAQIYSDFQHKNLLLTECGLGAFKFIKRPSNFQHFASETMFLKPFLPLEELIFVFSGSRITDRFSAVSEQINCIEKLLNAKQQNATARLLRRLQLEEKEKLLLTSAVLIEKLRLSDAVKQPEPDDSTIAFLKRSIETLTNKHTECIVRINEILEDLRDESADLKDT